MHDHIVEMGKNIVRRLYPNLPNRHSRLWIKEETENILVGDKVRFTFMCKEEKTKIYLFVSTFLLQGTEAIRCMIVEFLDPVIVMRGLRKMQELEFLEVKGSSNSFNYDNIDEDNLHLPYSLRYLCWHGYPFTCLPKKLLANNLVGLEMHHSNINQLWIGGEKKALKKIRFIDLSYCELRTLDVGLAMNLERLHLEQCSNLVDLHMPIESNLKFLSIRHCKKIRTLDLVRAQKLDILKVEECEDLVELHMPVDSLKLKHLSLQRCKLKILNLMWTQNLEKLHLEQCSNLVELHMPIESKLKFLSIRHCKLIRTLDLVWAQNLDTLNVEECEYLEELHMPVDSLKLKHLNLQWCKLKTLNPMWTQNLQMLGLKCENLVELHMTIENPKLKHLCLVCYKLKTLNVRQTRNLETLGLIYCRDLVELHLDVQKIKTLYLLQCYKLKTLNLKRGQNLEMLNLAQCNDLVELHMPIESPKLKNIIIHSLKLRTLNLTQARNLKYLSLECEGLLELHMPTESPELNKIVIGCSKLRTLYLGPSPYLKHLDLHNCSNLVEFHALVGCLSGSVRFKPCLVKKGFPMDGSLPELHLTARPLGICPLHPDNNLPKFHFECTYKELLLSSSENLAKLISLGLCGCTNLASLSGIICGVRLRKLTLEGSIPTVSKELDQLECLEELNLLSTNIEHVPNSIAMLKHLKFLRFKSCRFLKQLPENIGRLECLEELHVTDCTSLRDIPNNICELKCLKCFHLTDCRLVEKLPK
ncbi:putative leucine-rich repeat domain superfamily [Helianthus debilis subsp. tardiflorus]